MILTEAHIQKLQETADGSWTLAHIMRNIISFYREEDDDGLSATVKIRRTPEGNYEVGADISTHFRGNVAKYIFHESKCSKMFESACELRRNCEVFLTSEYNQCCELTVPQIRDLAELSRAFTGWIDAPVSVQCSSRGLTVSDPILKTLFHGENLDLAIQGGHLELDTGPGKMVTVWASKRYLMPLAQTMVEYLTGQGFWPLLSTVKDQFLGEDLED